MKGCGSREAEDRQYGKYVGAMLQSIIPLMDRTDSDNCHIPGRLNIPPIRNLEKLFTSSTSGNLAIGLNHAWSHLTTTFQGVTTQEQLIYNVLLLS